VTVHIIGALAIAEKHMELYRNSMRNAKGGEEYAHDKREFRKARNKILALKWKINN